MKAALCTAYGGPENITLNEIDAPEPASGEIRVSVKAAALNFLDTLMIRDKYQFKPPMPFAPSAEISGIIDKIGPDVTGFAPGDRVMSYIYWNGAQEQTIAKASHSVPLPDGVNFNEAAGLTVTYGTAIHGLKDRAKLQPGETLAVLGASGGAGMAAVEIGKLMGAKVIAVASTDEKLATCKKRGADLLFNYKNADLKTGLKELTDGKGVDVIYDCVGGPFAEPALRAIAWQGRFMVVGFAAGDIPKIPLNLMLLKGCDMLGVFWGKFMEDFPEDNGANMKQLLNWVAEGKLTPLVQQTFPLAQTADAVKMLDERKAVGKIVINP